MKNELTVDELDRVSGGTYYSVAVGGFYFTTILVVQR